MIGGGKIYGWEFNLKAGKKFSKTDSGISASCLYDLELFVTPNGQHTPRRYVKRIRAPAVKGNKDFFVSAIVASIDEEECKNKSSDIVAASSEDVSGSTNILLDGTKESKKEDHDDDNDSNERLKEDCHALPGNPPLAYSGTSSQDKQGLETTRKLFIKFGSTNYAVAAVVILLVSIFPVSTATVSFFIVKMLLRCTTHLLLYPVIILSLILALPRMVGFLLTKILYYTAMNRYPLVFGAIHLQPWMNDFETLHLRISAENVKFGNPPQDFQDIPWFLVCDYVTFRMSISTRNLLGLMNFSSCDWSPFPSHFSKNNLRERRRRIRQMANDEEEYASSSSPSSSEKAGRYCSCIQFQNIEFSGVTINFAEKNGVFNINGFTRALATGECRGAVESVFGPDRWPNTFVVRVLRCRGLKGSSTKQLAPNVRVYVRVRFQEARSRLHLRNRHPLINESFELLAKDPSSVVHVQVVDEGIGSQVIGNWVMTLKWFYLSPFFNHHNAMEVEKKKKKNGWVIKGWFPLLDDYFDVGADNGEIELWMSWTHKVENEGWQPKKLTSLQQITANSAETNLRLGNVKNVMTMLKRFPILFNLGNVTIRDIHFYLQDLFAGEAKDADSRQAIHMKLIEINDFKNTNYGIASGINLLDVLKQFSVGVALNVRSSTLSQGVTQVAGGLFTGFTSLFASTDTKVHTRDKKGRFFNLETIFATKRATVSALTAFDHDFWQGESMIKGFLEFDEENDARGFVLQKAEIRGACLFFHEVSRCDSEKTGPTQKIDLAMMLAAKIRRKNFGELIIETKSHQHSPSFFKFRVPSHVARPTLEDWLVAVQTHCVRRIPRAIHLELLRGHSLKSLDTDGGLDPYVIASVETRFGTQSSYSSRSSVKDGLNPKWNESLFLWPLDVQDSYQINNPRERGGSVRIDVWDDDMMSGDDLVGSLWLPMHLLSAHKGEHKEFRQFLCDTNGKEDKSLGSLSFKASIIRDVVMSKGRVMTAANEEEIKCKLEQIDNFASSSRIFRSLDRDGSGDLNMKELKPLQDVSDGQLTKDLHKFFGSNLKSSSGEQLKVSTLKYIDAQTLRALLGQEAEDVYEQLVTLQKKKTEGKIKAKELKDSAIAKTT